MITSVDTNILIDIFSGDKKFGASSARVLRNCIQEGTIIACEIVWVETATMFPNRKSFIEAIETLGIEFSAINQETALTAANSWHQYRRAGGKRERVVADFLIGAHAINQSEQLLTRDRGFYRKYFTSLKIIDPSTH